MDHILNAIKHRKNDVAKFPFKGGHLIQVKITKKDKHRTATRWLHPLNRGSHLEQVTSIAFV